jgi:serine/threonine protein kinase
MNGPRLGTNPFGSTSACQPPVPATGAAAGESGRLLGGHYRLESMIGRGSMGTVCRARDLRTGTLCAIKTLSQTAAQDDEEYRRFATEATIIAQLFHPNIVEVREFRRDALGTPFLVMELLGGTDLHSYLQLHGALPLDRVQQIVRQVASALHAVHGLGIIHRDVKPRNIFLAQQRGSSGASHEVVKLVDFGLSKIVGHLRNQTAQGIILGTPEYLSPEGTLGRSGLVDERTDQWALAATVYRMLTGRLPFENEDDDVIRLVLKIRTEAPPPLHALIPGLPEHAVSAVERGLQKRKEDRFPSVLEFARALCGLPTGLCPRSPSASMSTIPVLVPTESTNPTPCPSERRRPMRPLSNYEHLEQTQPIAPEILIELVEQIKQRPPVERGSSDYSVKVSVPPAEPGVKGPAVRRGEPLRSLRWLRVVGVVGLLAASGATGVWHVHRMHTPARLAKSSALASTPATPRGSVALVPEADMPPRPSLPSGRSLELKTAAPAKASIADGSAPPPSRREQTSGAKSGPPWRSRSSVRPVRGGVSSPAATVPSIQSLQIERAGVSAAGSVPAQLPLVPSESPPAASGQGAGLHAAQVKPKNTSTSNLDTSSAPRRIAGVDPVLLPSVRRLLGNDPVTGSYLLCIGTSGAVTSVKTLVPVPLVDEHIVQVLRSWRFLPRATPLCKEQELRFVVEDKPV